MDLPKLYTMQAELDRHIEEKHNLEDEDLFNRKLLALLVELGELANETRCFKFWSVKPASDESVILEEFVDGIHFILSLGNECGYTYNEKSVNVSAQLSLSEQFLKVYQSISQFQVSRGEKDYKAVFSAYLQLGLMLGFTAEKIEQAYLEKNEINYERQQTGY